MKILITGGTVFASRYSAEYFIGKGHEVSVINRNSRPQPKGVRLIECDRHDLGNKLKSLSFDLVYDITAYSGSDVSDLLDALGDFEQYILVSSSAVYPETLPQPFSENMTVGENIHWGSYGTNKIEAEKVLTERFPGGYIIRPPYLYGKMNNLYREAYVFECAERGMPFYVPKDGSMPLHFFDIEDMCRFAEILIKERPAERIFNVGNPQTVTVKEWAEACCGILGKKVEILSAPKEADIRSYFPFRDYSYVLDVSAQNRLMQNTKALVQGLQESYAWYKDHKELVIRKKFIEYINENFR